MKAKEIKEILKSSFIFMAGVWFGFFLLSIILDKPFYFPMFALTWCVICFLCVVIFEKNNGGNKKW